MTKMVRIKEIVELVKSGKYYCTVCGGYCYLFRYDSENTYDLPYSVKISYARFLKLYKNETLNMYYSRRVNDSMIYDFAIGLERDLTLTPEEMFNKMYDDLQKEFSNVYYELDKNDNNYYIHFDHADKHNKLLLRDFYITRKKFHNSP